MSTLHLVSLIVGVPVVCTGILALGYWIIADTHKYHQREALRTLKLQKLDYYMRTDDKSMLKDIERIEEEMDKI